MQIPIKWIKKTKERHGIWIFQQNIFSKVLDEEAVHLFHLTVHHCTEFLKKIAKTYIYIQKLVKTMSTDTEKIAMDI